MSDFKTEKELRTQAMMGKYGLYIPSGALWGAEDIKKMADRGTLQVYTFIIFHLSFVLRLNLQKFMRSVMIFNFKLHL